MQKARQLLSLCLLLCWLFGGCARHGGFDEADRAARALSGETGCAADALLQNTEWFPAGSSAADWLALTLKVGGVREDYSTFLNELETYVSQTDSAKMLTTAYARLALTVRALGGDPSAFGAVDLLREGYARWQTDDNTLNGTAFLLIAADACAYPDTQMRKTLTRAIVDAQQADGGFGLSSGGSDTDVTAMALQALSPYRSQYTETVDRALDYLAQCVTDNGACRSMGSENAETTAQVILALCALEMNIAADARFCTLPDGLLRFRLGNGLYRHTMDTPQFDVMATQQALLARIALQKGTNVYDF